MPRRAFEACSSCGCAKADCGLLSTRGLCQECSQMRMRDGATKGGLKRKSLYMPPSRTPQSRRTAKRLKKRPASAQASLCKHRLACAGTLSRDGFTIKAAELNRFLQHFDTFGYGLGEVRFVSDCVDMRVFGAWANKTRLRYDLDGVPGLGLATAFHGAIVYAHFNCLRTFGLVQTCIKPIMDWAAFKDRLLECGRRWGNVHAKKSTWAIYSPSCMSGPGLPPVPGGEYLDRFPEHFRSIIESPAFCNVVELLEAGVCTVEQAEAVRVALTALRKLVPGLLGDYHFKMLWDLTLASGWFPPHLVCQYPVCKNGGTATGLKRMFRTARDPSAAVMSRMLDTLTDIVRERARSWHISDHAGSVGAALCWRKRMDTAAANSSHESRYTETTAAWEHQLQQLSEAGLRFWWKQPASNDEVSTV